MTGKHYIIFVLLVLVNSAFLPGGFLIGPLADFLAKSLRFRVVHQGWLIVSLYCAFAAAVLACLRIVRRSAKEIPTPHSERTERIGFTAVFWVLFGIDVFVIALCSLLSAWND